MSASRDKSSVRRSKSYTLFSVTKEDRTSRTARIRELFKVEPLLAFLMAAFDFEWTVRRAIVAMSPCPTKKIHDMFAECEVNGLPAYKDVWKSLVGELRVDVSRSIGGALADVAKVKGLSANHFVNVGNVIKLRHVLVHGIRGSVKAEKVDSGFELLLRASEAISEYVDAHAKRKLYSRIVRRSACNKCLIDTCPIKRKLEAKKPKKGGQK